MVSPLDLKSGVTIELDGRVMQVVSAQRHKSVGRGGGMVRTKLRDVATGRVYDKTFRSSEEVTKAFVHRREHQYLYSDGQTYYFMDTDSYEQVGLVQQQVGDQAAWLKEGETVLLTTHEGKLIGIDLPKIVERRVVKTDPGLRGDTAQGGSKPAVIEGDVTVDVPLFIEPGELIQVDTETTRYVGRA